MFAYADREGDVGKVLAQTTIRARASVSPSSPGRPDHDAGSQYRLPLLIPLELALWLRPRNHPSRMTRSEGP
jgi:hypothetical protein